jgi:RNA polymerase sigma factor (TIGR02999 family)
MATPGEVTQLLNDWSNGSKEALDKLMPIVYKELRWLAINRLRNQYPDQSLQATALVHETYLRLLDCRKISWQDRAHFFGFAARLMRIILVDYVRSRMAEKRGGNARRVPLIEVPEMPKGQDVDLLALDEALTDLAAIDPQKSRLIELRYFGGLTIEETAEVLDISPATVKREWNLAKAWLFHEINSRV